MFTLESGSPAEAAWLPHEQGSGVEYLQTLKVALEGVQVQRNCECGAMFIEHETQNARRRAFQSMRAGS